jgi:hypothetical protein
VPSRALRSSRRGERLRATIASASRGDCFEMLHGVHHTKMPTCRISSKIRRRRSKSCGRQGSVWRRLLLLLHERLGRRQCSGARTPLRERLGRRRRSGVRTLLLNECLGRRQRPGSRGQLLGIHRPPRLLIAPAPVLLRPPWPAAAPPTLPRERSTARLCNFSIRAFCRGGGWFLSSRRRRRCRWSATPGGGRAGRRAAQR